jgi:hypothetical protein
VSTILLPRPPALPDGVTPTFEEIGAAPTAAWVRPPGSIVRFGTTYYWQAGSLTEPDWQPFPFGADLRAALLAEAADDLNVTQSSLLFDFHPFATRGIAGLLPVTNSGSIVNTQPLMTRASTVGGAGAFAWAVAGTNHTGYPRAATTGAATKWWIKARLKIPTITSLVAASRIGVGFTTTGGPQQLMGIVGSVSTANFAAFGANSGVAIDAALHDHKMWRDGTNGNYRVDTNATVQGVTAVGGDSAAALLNADLTGEVAARDVDAVYMAWAAVRP